MTPWFCARILRSPCSVWRIVLRVVQVSIGRRPVLRLDIWTQMYSTGLLLCLGSRRRHGVGSPMLQGSIANARALARIVRLSFSSSFSLPTIRVHSRLQFLTAATLQSWLCLPRLPTTLHHPLRALLHHAPLPFLLHILLLLAECQRIRNAQ